MKTLIKKDTNISIFKAAFYFIIFFAALWLVRYQFPNWAFAVTMPNPNH